MRFSHPPAPFWAACALLWPALQGCTQTAVAPPPPQLSAIEMRLQVKTGAQTEGWAGEALARHASRIAGLPVRHLAANGGGWHAVVLGCAELAQCDAGLQRLRAQGADFQAVEPDTRASRGPGVPTPASSR